MPNVSKLMYYPWSGHRVIMGVEKNSWRSVTDVLARFGKQRTIATDAYMKFLCEGAGIENDPTPFMKIKKQDVQDGPVDLDDRIRGEASFIRSIKKRVEVEMGEYAGIPDRIWLISLRKISYCLELISLVEKYIIAS